MKKNVLIIGAAGRDFHNFNTYYRGNQNYNVAAFTAAQIPDIDGRKYPTELAGDLYPNGIPIHPESQLIELIKKNDIDQVIFAYSDVPHERVMHNASMVNAAGADFVLQGTKISKVKTTKPLVTICATRTGCGKSQTSRRVAKILRGMGLRVVVIRHPMPYGDLRKQVCQRFATFDDLDKYECTIEEREEYEPHIRNGIIVYAGVDYEKILREAEKEADVIIWDGGNNDIPFYKPDLHIVVADPHRPGHEIRYHPGETNLRMADVVVINKVKTAAPENLEAVKRNIREVNPNATVIEAASPITVDNPELVKEKRVLVVEDGPTLTHGNMPYGAGVIASRKLGAREIVDPRPYAVGSIAEAFKKYSHLENVLPALGYGKEQIEELEKVVNSVPCDVVVIGTPIDLRRVLRLNKPAVRVTYELEELTSPNLEQILRKFLENAGKL